MDSNGNIINISSSQLRDYLNIPYQTLNDWLKKGLLGEKYVNLGRGKSRRFGFIDICVARVLYEIILMSGAHDLARIVVKEFMDGFSHYINQIEDKSIPYVYRELPYFIVFFEPQNDFYHRDIGFGWFHFKDENVYEITQKTDQSKPYIIFPIPKICEEVDDYLNKLR